MRPSLRFSLFLALTTTSAAAGAQTMAPVVIQTPAPQANATDNYLALRNGEHIHGQIIELHPNEYVIITLPEGNRTVPWSDIMHAEGPTFPGGYNAMVYAAPVGVPVAFAPPDYLHPQPGRVPLIIESAGPPQMVGESFTTNVTSVFGGVSVSRSHGLCTTPCTLYVSPSVFTIQSQARGFRQNVVAIAIPRNGLRVRLRAASRGAFYGGVGAAGGGGLLMASGVGFVLYAVGLGSIRSSGSFSLPQPAPFYAVGGTMLGLGAVAVVIGAIVVSSSRTGLESSSPLAPEGPQIALGPTADGFAAAMTMHF